MNLGQRLQQGLAAAALLAAACTPPTSAPQRAGALAGPAPTNLELAVRPSAPRSYTLTLRDRAALERRGPGPGRAHLDVAARVQLKRHDEPAGDGLKIHLAFASVDARSYGPLGAGAARALSALGGAKVTLVVDARGAVKEVAYEGPVAAKSAAERLARIFSKMSPAFASGARAIGGRWGESATLPIEIPGAAKPVNAALQANYVYQRQGQVNGKPCAVLQLDLRPSGNAAVEAAVEGAITTTGSGGGELCVDTQSGALLFGSFDLSLKTEVGARTSPSSRVRATHIEETRRIRVDITEGPVA